MPKDVVLVQRRDAAQVLVDRLADLVDLLLGGGADRVELRFEHPHQALGDGRIRRHRVVAVVLRVSRGDPHPIVPERPQDPDLPPRERAQRHETVQRVRVALPAPDRRDRVGDALGSLSQLQDRAARVEHAEVVDVHATLALDRRRHLLDDAEPERLEDRHEVGEIHLPAGLVELHAGQTLALRLVPEADQEPFGARLEPLEHEHVVDDQAPVVVRLVVVGEPRRVLVQQGDGTPGADAFAQRLEQVVLPRAGEQLDLSLELLVADVGDRHAGGDVDREEDPGRLGLPQREVVVDRRSVEAFEEQGLQTLAEVGVEPIPRQRDHDRDVPPVEVASDQNPDAAVLLEL